MKIPRLFFIAAALFCCALAAGAPFSLGLKTDVNPDAAATVVVYNESDPESRGLAEFYAQKRGIPKEQLVGLKCATAEEISRAEYDTKIAEPLRKAFTSNFWWTLRGDNDPLVAIMDNRIRFMALMRGVPLKIAAEPNYPGDKPAPEPVYMAHNEASVESELTILALRSHQISGVVQNPYYRSYKTVHEAHNTEIMLVTRLDGPSAPVVRRMILDAIDTEQNGLRGFAYIDARGTPDPGLKEGDTWLQNAANFLQREGTPVILDKGEGLFPDGYPMRNAAFYFGWYSEHPAGPFAGKGIRFRPGAIACHIHSFSGVTVRHPEAHWVGPLLQQGAAAVIGNVYEPYLALTPNLDVFVERLKGGFTFAEAAYMSLRVLSWQTTLCGDPLYRPFPIIPVLATTPEAAEWDAYHDGAVKWVTSRPDGEAQLKKDAARLKSGLLWEGLGLLQIRANDVPAGVASFEEARKAYKNEEDILRAAIHEVIQLQGAHREADAVAVATAESKVHKNAPAVGVLRMLVPAAFGEGKK